MLVTDRCSYVEAILTLAEYRDTGFINDVESDGLDMYAHEAPARLCSIQLAPIVDSSKRFYFPFRHKSGVNLPLEAMDALRELVHGTGRLAHNQPFDTKMLLADGFALPPWVKDSRVAAAMANENEKATKQGKAYALKKLRAQYFGEDTIATQTGLKAELKRRKLSTANGGMENLHKLPPEVVYQYGIDDLTHASELHNFMLEKLKTWRLEEAYERKCHAMLALIKMEHRGVLLDIAEVDRQEALLAPRIADLVTELKALLGDINLNSSQQVAKALGLPKTDAKFLKAIVEGNPQGANPAIRKLLEYREAKKAASTYFKPFKQKADVNGRLHTSFNPVGARTGRYSSSGPNMQNCSKDRQSYSLKRCFKAAPGWFLMEADYSSLEPRVGAYFTKDPGAIEVFQKGLDYYKPIAAKMFRLSETDITKELRDSSKSTALGVGYGMGSFKLAVTQGLKHPRLQDGSYEWHSELVWHMPKDGDLCEVPCSEVHPVYCTCEGRKLVRWFFDAVPSMQPTIKAVTSTMQRNGYIRFPLSGRVRRLERFYNPERQRWEDNSHKTWNSLLQGTGADIMEAAIIAIDEQVPEQDARMLITVHDSLLFEVREGPQAQETIERILWLMENTTKIPPVPLLVEAKIGSCWGDMVKYNRLASGMHACYSN